MASQRMALWAAEDMEEDLQDVDYSVSYTQPGQYDDAHIQAPQIDEQTLIAMQQHIAQQTAFAQIPDVVKAVSFAVYHYKTRLIILQFIVQFHRAVLDNNLAEITVAYDSGWNKFTEKFYAKTEWPEAEIIAPLVNDDPVFLILYRELYYRHVYSRLTPNIDDRFHSYENSCELFNYLLNSEGPVALQLPEQWLWDIIDEFIYQFQVFCSWRSKSKNFSEDELAMLSEGGGVSAWSDLCTI
jgi:translation initiation factor 3 subunit L